MKADILSWDPGWAPKMIAYGEWCCWICDLRRGFNSGAKDSLCHWELWVDFIKATGIEKASNNRHWKGAGEYPPCQFLQGILYSLASCWSSINTSRLTELHQVQALSHNIHICTRGVLYGWDTLYKSWRKTDF